LCGFVNFFVGCLTFWVLCGSLQAKLTRPQRFIIRF
jgi:hypothetical protein